MEEHQGKTKGFSLAECRGRKGTMHGLKVSLFACVQPIAELVEDGGVIQVNDKALLAPLRIKLKYADAHAMQP